MSGRSGDWRTEAAELRAMQPRHILFLCVANSARSQMAEGIARSLAPQGVRVSSAGSSPASVHPQAIRVLKEIGIDISGHRSKGLDSIDAGSVDAVITLCAEEVCPVFLGKALRGHWGLSDPAGHTGTEETRLNAFRSVRDELRRRLKVLFGHGEGNAVKEPHAIAIVGNSGAGKTTLLERLIPALKRKGVRVGAVKHDAHRFDIDHPGKDSHRLTVAGADTMVITSPEKLAMVKRHSASPPIEELLGCYFTDMDLVLVEGFRGSSLPKIEVHRKEFRRALICRGERNDPGLAAVASDEPLDLDVPVLDLNDPEAIAEFIASLLPGIEGKP
ncbi:MAG: molybdopterin-guanine dinucleotide biosynthesis protein B [Desulfobacteria bacterium]